MFLGDFHLHSSMSDGVLSIPQLVNLMGGSGMGAIAITDHLCEKKSILGQSARFLSKSLTESNFSKYLDTIYEQAELAKSKHNMLVLPGVEITKNSFSHKSSAHILAIGIKSYIDPDLSVVETIHAIHEQGGLAVAAHPVDTGKKEFQTRLLWEQREELESLMDAWEVSSGNTLFPAVKESSLCKIANSDLHHPYQLESWKTQFYGERSFDNIKSALRAGNVEFFYYKPQVYRPAKGMWPESTAHIGAYS